MTKLSFKTFNYWGYGIYNDLKSRIPHYKSDFVDAFNYRVIPSTTFIFFTNLLPALAFSQDMFDKTKNSYGVNEVLMSSALAGVVFGLFSGQPLCIVGVTGPISIFSYTVFELIEPRGTPYFPFMCWIYLWSMVFHFVIALGNYISFLKIISLFSCDAFGFFICLVYIQKGIQILARQFDDGNLASGYCSVMISLLMIICGVGSFLFGKYLHYFNHWIRKIFVDYGVCISVIFFTGFIHFGGHLSETDLARLPTASSFQPTFNGLGREHGWFIHFWPGENIAVSDVFLAIPFAILLTFLFYFDHNVSSLMCQSKEYPLKKPSSFHWDFFLLGITTGIAGILGLPAPNGLIPQAPLHTDSLVVHNKQGKVLSVVEQRVTNTVQGLLTFIVMTKPFLVVLGLIPQAVLSGLFFIMAITGLHGNIVTNRLRFLFLDAEYIEYDDTCPEMFKQMQRYENKKWFYIYLLLEVIAGVSEFAITLTKGAVGFPGVLMLFAICAKWIWPLIIPKEELAKLDGDVADQIILENLNIIEYIKVKENNSQSYKDELEENISNFEIVHRHSTK
ncbi:HCO3 transporter family-domain-containing protein [Scheffersomyces amazonensis]|uniref:HCO3 transporter family-domain-containing protein n=1 Tax=Scheffersomyces amazonensis TaxID=1078765 RepID=UPI00315DA3DD